MERFDILFKSVLTFVGTLFSIVANGLGLSFTILIIMQAADYATGLIAAATKSELNSSVGFKGIAKKIYVLILVGIVYLLEVNVLGTTHLADGVAIAYIVMEFISITENGGKMGAPIPPIVSKLIERLNGKGEEGK